MKIEILLDRIKAVYPEFIIEKAEMKRPKQPRNNH